MTLLGAIDDASSQVVALHFRPTEDLHGYATIFQHMFLAHGLPLALYGDGIGILVRNDSHWSPEEELAGVQHPTHLGRVLRELGIGYVQARSPQGKGRVERLWGTLQDRLVSELRLRGITTREAANAFLPEFIADFNPRFARPPALATPVWRPAPRDLDRILSCRYAPSPATTPSGSAPGACRSPAARTAAPSPAAASSSASCWMAASSCSTKGSASPPRRPPPPTSRYTHGAPRRPPARSSGARPLPGPHKRPDRAGGGGGPSDPPPPSVASRVFPPPRRPRTPRRAPRMTFSCCSWGDIFIDQRHLPVP